MELATANNYVGVSTAQIVDKALKENTGRHFLDSGGAYGHHFERNQGRDFAAGPKAWCNWRMWVNPKTGLGEPEPSTGVSLYHWMVDNLDFDAEMQTRFDEFSATSENGYLGDMEEFASLEATRFEHEKEPEVFNSYNESDDFDLSQVIQYALLYIDDSYEPSHVIVSVHGGCDVRGGYGTPHCFRIKGEWFGQVRDSAAVRTLYAGDHRWYYNDGGWRDCDTDFAHGDICKLPCFDLDSLEDPTLLEFKELIARSKRDLELLDGTHLTATQLMEAREQIEITINEVQEEFESRAIELLDDQYDAYVTCTYVKDNKLFLVHLGIALEVEASS